MEAWGGAHFWGREIGKLGHAVRLIPADYVMPFVKRQKSDAADAKAIWATASAATRSRAKRYRYAAEHLVFCARLAGDIADFGAFEAHDAFVARLKEEHGR